MTVKTESIQSFYDAVAPHYNSQMTTADSVVREAVRKKFQQHVPVGKVLDFGGGTGLDLPWMTAASYQVFFLEPSEGMRTEAKDLAASQKMQPIFIEEKTDFEKWSSQQLPFADKMNGVLLNFAVLNCIERPDIFFEKIGLIMDSNSTLMITMLNSTLTYIVKNYSWLTAIRLLQKPTVRIYRQYQGVHHATYLHSIRAIQKSSKKYFDHFATTVLPASEFIVMTFRKK